MNRKISIRFLCTIFILCTGIPAFAGEPETARPESGGQNEAPEKKAARHESFSDMARAMFEKAAQPEKNTPERGAVSADARRYVDAVQGYYDGAKTYSAAFDQEYETVDGIKKQSSGVVWFKKPGMMRWDYEKPETRFLISDGRYFWSWEPEYRQFCKQNLKGSQLPTALSFLTGTGKLEDEFSIRLLKVSGEQVFLELRPVEPSMAFDKIQFELLMPSAKVYRATIYDAMGNLNRITFKSPEINAALDDASFQFTPPSDARQICE